MSRRSVFEFRIWRGVNKRKFVAIFEKVTHCFVCSYCFFPKRKVFFEVSFHGNVGVRLFIFSGFLFPFIISFYFIFCGTNVSLGGMSISNAVVHHIWNSNLLSPFHAKVSKIGWNLDVGGTNSICIGRDTVCYYYLLESNRAWYRHSKTAALFPCCGFRRVDEGLKELDFDLIWFVFFFFNALVSACRVLLQSSESHPIGSFSYSTTTAQPPSVESTILINLFLWFSLEMIAFNDVETGSCSSEMLSLMSYRSSIIAVLNLCLSLWFFCLKVSTWILRFFSVGSLSLFFLIWFWISWNLESK